MIDILMPRLSDTMEEGVIVAWRKKPGEAVEIGDVLVEIETDKATMEHEAYEAGTLHEILLPEGETVRIGTVIARIDDGREPLAGTPPRDGTSQGKPPAPATSEPPIPESGPAPATDPAPTEDGAATSPPARRPLATPLVRRLARDNAIDLNEIIGSGPGGRIIRADLDRALARGPGATGHSVPAGSGGATTPNGGVPTGATSVPFDTTRQVISRRLTESSSSVPHFSVTAVADVEELLALRARINAELDDAGQGKVSLNDLIVRASAVALREHPGVNASYSEEGRGATLLHEHVNIGIAVASDHGLVVPVIADADRMAVSRIAAESRRLVGLAKDRKLSGADMTGGTFTISNLGMYQVESFTAIINPPEGAILAVGAALPEPAAVEGAVAVRHRIRCTLSADHRIIDGALAARFLSTLTSLLEHPLRIIA
ncbi:dihydrolipoamide acetyltransferase family protein [Actinoalloteichus caeruleus]|uniref:dihydrolipoamide acetyltransferase family protein n=1 Tax=Actinoalloteichus cyanogriseus TaxID=2893586 RepID=UPI003AB08049